MNSAFRDIIVLKDYTILKAVGVAILASMIGFAILQASGAITVNPMPFFWGANIIGGFIFGIGMVLAGGCASGTTYRFGEGMVGSMVAAVGLTAVGLITAMGVFKPAAVYLQEHTLVTYEGGSPTLFFGAPYYAVAFGIAGTLILLWIFLAMRRRRRMEVQSLSIGEQGISLYDRFFKRGWGWLLTGIAMGLIGTIAFYASASSGRNYPLAITGGYLETMKTLFLDHNFFTWLGIMLLFTIIGAFIAAIVSKEFRLRAPPAKTLVLCFFGGCLMGFGAVCQQGCNITHILSGVPQLSFGSMLGGLFIILGCWAAAWWIFIRPMGKI